MSALSGTFGGLEGKKEASVNGSIRWQVDFFREGPPPVVIEQLRTRGLGFFQKVVMLLDIKRYIDARTILLVRRGVVGSDEIQLASSFAIYVVIEGENGTLRAAAEGGEVSEINQSTLLAISHKSRRASGECRSEILELLSERWLTGRELQDELRWRFDPGTVYSKVRALERSKAIAVLGRTKNGEGVLGVPGAFYRIREDLSAPSKKMYISNTIRALLKDRCMSYAEISDSTGIRKQAVSATLRELSRNGFVRRSGSQWASKT